MVLRFDQIDGSMVAAVGGKAANLGTLTRSGLPVPDGFCVTTDAYRQVVGTELDELFDQLGTADSDQLAGLAGQARQRVATAPVPAALRLLLRESCAALGRGPVAVRSSATAEDLDVASFAGQQDTFLNVVGEEDLLDAVRRCWASLWTDRAVSYRNTHGIHHSEVALAVVVQRMVQSRASGVMFTANPVTGSRRQTVVDASPGLGEAVVSGAVNPDHFVVDTATGTIVQRRLGDKRVLIRSLPGGGTERVDQPDSSSEAALTDHQVLELAALGRRVQEAYGTPQDTEWAVDDDAVLWLTQSRPITTLYPLPDRISPAGTRIYMCMTLAQGLTRPITPMGLAAFRLIGSSIATAAGAPPDDELAGPRAFTVAGQRAFVDFTDALRNPLGRRAALTLLAVMEARTSAVLAELVRQPEFTRLSGACGPTARRIARIAARVRAPQRVLVAAVRPAWAYRAIAHLERQLRADLVVAPGASPLQRLDVVQRLLGRVFWFMPTVIAYPLAGFGLLALVRRLLRGVLQPGDLQTIFRGLPHNITTEMDLELWDLRVTIGADPASRADFVERDPADLATRYRRGELPEVAQHGLARFLDRYGHRAVAEIDLGMPRWSDDPTHIVGVLTNYLRHHDPALAADLQFRAGSAAAEAMIDSLVERARSRGRLRAVVVAFGLRRARALVGLREAPKNLLVLALAGIRRELAVVGDALVADGRISTADDVYFLDLTEARRGLAGADLHEVVGARRQAYESELRRRHIPRILLSDGTEPEAVASGRPGPEGSLRGSPASAGTVSAPARVILDPVGAHLEPGEILVAPSTDPGWTPLFLTAGGLVMEMGGANSHGAVVAREYGIPAVVGVPEATTAIETGQVVTVDGAAGLVTPVPAARTTD